MAKLFRRIIPQRPICRYSASVTPLMAPQITTTLWRPSQSSATQSWLQALLIVAFRPQPHQYMNLRTYFRDRTKSYYSPHQHIGVTYRTSSFECSSKFSNLDFNFRKMFALAYGFRNTSRTIPCRLEGPALTAYCASYSIHTTNLRKRQIRNCLRSALLNERAFDPLVFEKVPKLSQAVVVTSQATQPLLTNGHALYAHEYALDFVEVDAYADHTEFFRPSRTLPAHTASDKSYTIEDSI